jgi:DNA-binding Lrp family transcriptional regulator
MNEPRPITALDALDRRIVVATQAGLPLVPEPFRAVAELVGTTPEDVIARLRRMAAAGVVRRIAAVPNHYALGWRANGMSVWDVTDTVVPELGPKVGAMAEVSHCYLRPRRPPRWPYNLFAMVHGRARDDVDVVVTRIAALLGEACHGHDVLYSTRILKKTGLRLAASGGD